MEDGVKQAIRYAVFLLLFAAACTTTLAGPTENQLRQDLVGKEFSWSRGALRAHITGVKDLTVQQRFTDRDAKTEEVLALVTVTSGGDVPDRTLRGVMKMSYKHFEQGWMLQGINGTEADFTNLQ